jgi:hypothetical protein
MERKTQYGIYVCDPSGLSHYKITKKGKGELAAATDAIVHRKGPSWIWLNGIPVPINPTDTPMALIVKRRKWMKKWLAAPEMLAHFAKYAGIKI